MSKIITMGERRQLASLHRQFHQTCLSLARAHPSDWYESWGRTLTAAATVAFLYALAMRIFFSVDEHHAHYPMMLALEVVVAVLVTMFAVFWVTYDRSPLLPRWAHQATPLSSDQQQLLLEAARTSSELKLERLTRLASERPTARSVFWSYIELGRLLSQLAEPSIGKGLRG